MISKKAVDDLAKAVFARLIELLSRFFVSSISAADGKVPLLLTTDCVTVRILNTVLFVM